MSFRFRSIALSVVAALVVGACSLNGGGSPPPSQAATEAPSSRPTASVEPTPLVVGLGFIPNVQFAPFYYAQEEGLYAAAGLDVEFQNKIDPDLISLIGQGSVDIGLADGTSVIPAVSQGFPIRYVATIYGKFPSIVFAKASSGIAEPADLAGVRLGIPGRYGSSWIMLQALLSSAGLSPDDLEIVEYPDFGQGAAVAADAVGAATGFANNEPVQLQLAGEAVNVLRVDEIVPLPGNGLITGVTTATEKADAIRAFVDVTLAAMEAIAADPQLGLDATYAVVPELAGAPEVQAAVLDATIEVWRGPVQEAGGLGAISLQDWDRSIEYLASLGLVPEPVSSGDMVDTTFLPAGS